MLVIKRGQNVDTSLEMKWNHIWLRIRSKFKRKTKLDLLILLKRDENGVSRQSTQLLENQGSKQAILGLIL